MLMQLLSYEMPLLLKNSSKPFLEQEKNSSADVTESLGKISTTKNITFLCYVNRQITEVVKKKKNLGCFWQVGEVAHVLF